jgi:hypothetical protein
MPSSDDVPVPYADPEPLSDLIEECRCAEAECESHGINLHPDHHDQAKAGSAPLVVDEATRHIVDGISEYGG